ncbi:MAG TPA: AAA family ATPase [Anaerohalosphaeraceae bacterium]|nr:AAA family ATPase [Anaerohalosphaeraceae bacterium]
MNTKENGLVNLVAENFQRLKAINITPNANTVLITGKNGAGKSSVLDSIVSALCGKDYCPEKPIRTGEKGAKVELDLGKYKVTRTFTEAGGGTLKVESKDGFKAGRPQELLDSIVGEIAFDPMRFIKHDAKKQRDILMKLVGLNFADIDARLAEVKSKRQVANAEKTKLGVELAGRTFIEGLPLTEISMAELTNKLRDAIQHNNAIQRATNEYVRLNNECTRQFDHIKSIDEKIQYFKNQIALLEVEKTTESSKLDVMLEKRNAAATQDQPIDIAPIQAELNSVESKNKQIRQNLIYLELKDKLAAAMESFCNLGKQAEAVEAEKQQRLMAVKFPVEGLSVDESGVTYDGIPLAQVNTAKKLQIGIAIGMKLNPTLRVIRMSGNDLDSESLAEVSKMVEAEGYQAWIERVDESGKVGFVIQDGSLADSESDA